MVIPQAKVTQTSKDSLKGVTTMSWIRPLEIFIETAIAVWLLDIFFGLTGKDEIHQRRNHRHRC
jgi:hypothetical protein